MSDKNAKMEQIISLCKRRGFVFPGSDIYGGFAGTYDWGPLGFELRRNAVDAWIESMRTSASMAFLDSSIVTAPRVWEASGHTSGFSDPLVICNNCHSKLRADHLLEGIEVEADENLSEDDLNSLFDENRKELVCPVCGKKDFGKITKTSLLVSTTLGKFDAEDESAYLRGETAQGIYINFKNVLDTGFYRIPFGIAQIGKAFRNEISPRQFLFRKREFEQMEMQYFVKPETAEAEYKVWKEKRMNFYKSIGISDDHLQWKQHENLVFYAKDAWDIEYKYPFGWSELEGIHHRSDYDLTQHTKFSGVDMSVYDEATSERYTPYVVETSVGLDRLIFAILTESYEEEDVDGKERKVLHLDPKLAPTKVAVSPLLRNKPELVEKAREVYEMLQKDISRVTWDDNGNIGKRYRRQDEIGTPFCVVYDFDSLEDECVTVRDRDSLKQERVKISEIVEFLNERLSS